MNDRPSGKRFSHLYLERGKPTDDSPRMRARVGSVLDEWSGSAQFAQKKLGIQTPYSLNTNWARLLPSWALADVLDLITVAHEYFLEMERDEHYWRQQAVTRKFLAEVQQIFHDENVHYEVDAEGGVHYRHDEEFARTKSATIGALQDRRYANVLDAFHRAMSELGKPSPDGKHAIRAVFAAAEALFKLILPGTIRLGSAEAEKLGPLIQKRYASDMTAARSSAKLLASFKDWIDAAHFYRHEEGKPDEVAQPPLEVALHIVSAGAAHIRWLVQLDDKAVEAT